ncbi:MAG: hypothetical protein H6797_05480 [Candidatus Nomurabacteria bacterium]|nr:MAG: hypothetical protein H6797_05480 [Candidatus Nomurabacteria bacterium]
MIKFIYTVFLGFIITLFVGLGVSTFYSGPEEPQYPIDTAATKDGEISSKQSVAQARYEKDFDVYQTNYQQYNRNVSIITLVAAVFLLALGLLSEHKKSVNSAITDGIVLSSVFTLIYSIIRGFVSTDTKFTFVVVTVSVAIALYLGHRTFTQLGTHKTKASKN